MSCAITKDSYVIRILLSEVIFLTWLLSLQNITPYAISYKISHGEKNTELKTNESPTFAFRNEVSEQRFYCYSSPRKGNSLVLTS